MSKKHFFNDGNGLVLQELESFVAANPFLSLIPREKVIYNPHHSKNKVSIISGGGGGHLPAWSGFVGNGFLTAAVSGDIFASPSAKQILAAISSASSDQGIILVITNYTGDKLHFGLAVEKAKALNLIPASAQIGLLPITDDVTLPKGSASIDRVGRRGLAGNVLVLKVIGAYADLGKSYNQCLALGQSLNANTVTSGSSLDHCHVPGRTSHEEIPEDACILGMGIHNEQGLKQLSPIPEPKDLINMMLNLLVDPSDESRSFVKFQPNDWVILLVNNFGGVSLPELGALTTVTMEQLKIKWNIIPKRILSGIFETSLNGPGFSISLSNLSAVSRETGLAEQELLDLLNAKCYAPAWPNLYTNEYGTSTTANNDDNLKKLNGIDATSTEGSTLIIPQGKLNTIISTACNRAIESEPKLTEWDTIMGDGDCGIAVKETCQKILQLIEEDHKNGNIFNSGNVLIALGKIIDILDDMGGSLGAILCIWLSSFVSYLSEHKTSKNGFDINLTASAANSALEALYQYTAARLGDRTVMDTLIPFCQELANTHDLNLACIAAHKAADNTRNLTPKFGRATYVTAAEDDQASVPDPGAWAIYEIIQGIVDSK